MPIGDKRFKTTAYNKLRWKLTTKLHILLNLEKDDANRIINMFKSAVDALLCTGLNGQPLLTEFKTFSLRKVKDLHILTRALETRR